MVIISLIFIFLNIKLLIDSQKRLNLTLLNQIRWLFHHVFLKEPTRSRR